MSVAPARVRTSAIVSTAIGPLVRGGLRPLEVFAAFPQASYLRVADGGCDRVITLVTCDGVHHPNAAVLTIPSEARPLASIRTGQQGAVGEGRLEIAGIDVRVSRWWNPRPRLRPWSAAPLSAASDLTRQRLVERAGRSPAMLTDPLDRITAALARDDSTAAFAAAQRLVGLGPGLTPAGDDVLAGLVAGILVLAPAHAGGEHTPRAGSASDVRSASAEALPSSLASPSVASLASLAEAARALGRAVAAHAVGRTTSVSAALLAHAADGQLATPATDLLRAWTAPSRGSRLRASRPEPQGHPRHGDAVVAATDRLLRVGSTSGHDLAIGLLAAAELAADTASAAVASPGAASAVAAPDRPRPTPVLASTHPTPVPASTHPTPVLASTHPTPVPASTHPTPGRTS